MTISRATKYSRTLFVLFVALIVCCPALGTNALAQPRPAEPTAPASEAVSGPSVTCTPFGLYGDITTPPLVDRLSDGGDNLTFVGTTNGLYVVASGGRLQHFLYTPFGIRHIALINDITGDGTREVVVALNDTQVPALRCYDGANWEEIWRFAPMARIFDQLWVERQLFIRGLQVTGDGDSQSVVVTFGRCALSVNAADGTERWRFSASSAIGQMAAVADLTGDDTDELVVGSNDGQLRLLDGRTGQSRWQTTLTRHKGIDYDLIQNLVGDIIALDGESGKVMVSSADGWVQMYDLAEKRRDWEARVFEDDATGMYFGGYDGSAEWHISPTPDITGDGLPEALMTRTSYSEYPYRAYTTAKAALCDSAGEILWDRDSTACGGLGLQADSFEGKSAFIETDGQEINLIDLEDGKSVLHVLTLSEMLGVIVRQPGGDGYVAFSAGGDLAAISSKGEILWAYPRVGSVTAKSGDFVGDGTSDVLFCAERSVVNEYGYVQKTSGAEGGETIITEDAGASPGSEPEVRLLHVMDGATGAMVWSYQVPFSELQNDGGLLGIQVTPDLVGNDGVSDIVGYRGDTVFIFSGRDGNLTSFPTGQPIADADVVRNGLAGNALALTTSGAVDPTLQTTGGLLIVDLTGAPLWSGAAAEWLGEDSGGFMILDDVNSDNISDVALTSAPRILVLKSVAGIAGVASYELHQALEAEQGHSISHVELVPDADQDGVRDLACIQNPAGDQQSDSACSLLLEKSPVSGKDLFKANLPQVLVAYDLACGDFNGDGYADSLLTSYANQICGSTASSQGNYALGQPNLWILSGKDGAPLRVRPAAEVAYKGYGGTALPVTNIGDVDGDGAEDLAYASCPLGAYEYYGDGYSYTPSGDQQLRLNAYSAAKDSILQSVAATPALKTWYYDRGTPAPLRADLDGDGHFELICDVIEPDIPSYDPDAYRYYDGTGSGGDIAVVDLDGSRRLAGFTGFSTSTVSLFETHRPGVLGVAACGGACLLRVDADLQVTSPEDGARTGPNVGVAWEGPADGDFSQVFVDGVRNDITYGLESSLFLARGDHDIVVRSVDDSGRISYGPADMGVPVSFEVSASPWKPVWLVLSLLALLAVSLALFYARLHRAWRARKRVACPLK